MISVSFINNENETLLLSDPFLSFERAMVEMNEEIDETLNGYLNVHNQYMVESEIMGELSSEKTVYLESERTNIFDKIGNAVITIFKKFAELVKKVVDSIKNIGFKNKSNEEKMRDLLDYYKKNDPDKYRTIKDDVVVAFKSGELDPIDMKSIKEMNEAYDELVKLAKQKDVKPDSLKAKFEAMKKKFDGALDKGTVKKTATVVSSVVTAALAIATFKSKILDSKKNTMDYEKKLSEKNEATIKAIKELEQYQGGEFASDSLTKAQLLQNAHFWITKEYGKLISKEQGKIDKFDKGITSWIARHEKSKKDDFMNGVNRGASVISDKEKEERKAERKKNREDAYDKSKSQIKAKAKWDKKHPEEEIKDDDVKLINAEKIAAAQRRGQNSATDEPDDDVLRNRARQQRYGQREGDAKYDKDHNIKHGPQEHIIYHK